MPAPKAAIAWSTGKDACLALLRARELGLMVPTFVTLHEQASTSKLNALSSALINAQIAALSGSWFAVQAVAGQVAQALELAFQTLRDTGHSHIVFGDIDSHAQRDWIEFICRTSGITPLFPLWDTPRAWVADEVISRGIKARLLAVDTLKLDALFCGTLYDSALLTKLPRSVCPCGENGEFQTFVIDAPIMSKSLEVTVVNPARVTSQSSAINSVIRERLDLKNQAA